MRNVTQFTSAMRGPHQKLWNNWNPIEKFAPVWEIAQIRARNALLFQQLLPFDCSET